MKCLILAGGPGARTYPVTKDTAKALFPVRGMPAISHIVNKVQSTEKVDEIFVISNQRFYPGFKAWLDDFPAEVPIKILNDGSLNCKDSLGALNCLSFAIDSCRLDDDLLIIGGDNLFSFGLDEFIESSLAARPNPSIGVFNLNGRTKAKKYGIVKLGENNRVIDFYKKPPEANNEYLISLCLYYLPKEVVPSVNTYLYAQPALPAGRRTTQDAQRNKTDPIGNYIKWLIKQHRVRAFNFEGEWFGIGDVDSYADAVCLL